MVVPAGLPQEIEPSANIIALRQDVIHLLKSANEVVTAYNQLNKTNFSGTVPIQQALVNVEELALRMAVVAPMKAGKSTITNAIVGQPLLPSRNTAMTAIATEILLDTEATEPTLIIPDETLDLFQEAAEKIREADRKNPETVRQQLREKYPHLQETLKDITDNRTLFTLETSGLQKVRSALQQMNDLVRLTSEVVPAYNPVKRMRLLPQVYVAPFTPEGEAINTGLGNLVIIDTPGPNEAGENLEIKNIFAEQLKRSSLILVVLDFTQLNTEAAKDVQDTIKEITDIRGGTDSIYALVNKIDQRRPGDMTPEQVQEFVQNQFKIPRAHVYELSAQRAYCAACFLNQSNLTHGEEWRTLPETRDLAREIFGDEWEELLEDMSRKKFTERAKKQWKERSGFQQFCTKVIHGLMKIVGPKVMRESLNTTQGFMNQLLQGVALRQKANQKDVDKLKEQIQQLSQDMDSIKKLVERLGIIEQYKNNIKNHLENEVNKLKEQSKIDINHLFDEEKYSQASLPEKIYRDINAKLVEFRDFVANHIPNHHIQGLLTFMTNSQKTSGKEGSGKKIQFDSKEKATEFQQKIFDLISKKVEYQFSEAQKSVDNFVEEAIQKLKAKVPETVQPILEKAQKRLEKAFDMQLDPPNLEIPEMSLSHHGTKIQEISERVIRIRIAEKRFWWHWLWLIPKEVEETYVVEETYEETVPKFVVSLDEVINDINHQIDTQAEEIQKTVNKYLEQDFKTQVEQYIQSLTGYLSDYRTVLTESQEYQKKSTSEKEEKMQQLKEMEDRAKHILDAIPTYLNRVNVLLPSSSAS
ncbi:MAG: dynamin family protein [Bdellovibrionaceae bacterium]|nr:dynamin family protein [Pseudobdellovibrionaceae bacterium]